MDLKANSIKSMFNSRLSHFIMLPTSNPNFKEVEGDIGFGLSVRPYMTLFFACPISYEPCMLGF